MYAVSRYYNTLVANAYVGFVRKRNIQAQFAEGTSPTRSTKFVTVGAYAIWNYDFLLITTSS